MYDQLASDEAGWCTEQAISVDGGLSILYVESGKEKQGGKV
jgi:hypothetical protein